MIALRQAAEEAGGEVIAISHRVGTHIFAPKPDLVDPDGNAPSTETPRDPDAGDTPEKITGKRKAAE